MKAFASYCITSSVVVAFLVAPWSNRAHAQGQQGSGSPYSAYGLGELAGSSQTVQAMMGGVGIALADPFGVSRINPASYPFLVHTTFEAGVVLRNLRYDTEAFSTRGRNTTLQGLSLGVPFGKGKWGMALGVQPVSSVNYRITDQRAVEGGTATLVYNGTGGLNRAYVGFGRILWQRTDTLGKGGKLSVGANLDYMFGTVETTRKIYYPSGNAYFNSKIATAMVVRSPMASVGLQYTGDIISLAAAKQRMAEKRKRLKAQDEREEMEWLNAGKDPALRKPVKMPKREGEALRFRIGLASELPASLSAKNTLVANNFLVGSTGVEFPRDTALFLDGTKGHLAMPPLYGLGFTVYNTRWTLSVEHRRRDWSQLKVEVEGLDLRSDLTLGSSYAIGASWRPAGKDERKGFWERTIYRMGASYSDDYLVVDGTALNRMSATMGLSLPLMGSNTRSRFNIGAEFGQRGTTDNGLLRERYADVFIGITITPDLREQWFRRRRIE